MVTQIIDDGAVGSDETADAGQALREGAHDEIHLVGQAEVIAHTPTLTSEDT